jgi:hypothetical protein
MNPAPGSTHAAEQPIEQPKDWTTMDPSTHRRTPVRLGGYTLDFLLATRNARLTASPRWAGKVHGVTRSPATTANADRYGTGSLP